MTGFNDYYRHYEEITNFMVAQASLRKYSKRRNLFNVKVIADRISHLI